MIKFLVDESVDYAIIKKLRQLQYEVVSIMDISGGTADPDVLLFANNHESVLLTEDKDFGELVYRFKMKHKGIVFIRLDEQLRQDKIEITIKVILLHGEELINKFSVITARGVRIRANI